MFKSRLLDRFLVGDFANGRIRNFLFKLRMHFQGKAGGFDRSELICGLLLAQY